MPLDLLRTLIIDGQRGARATGVRRRLNIQNVRNKAAVLIGVRRCGKSTVLAQLAARHLAAGGASENVLWLDFFDDRLHDLARSGLGQVSEAYYSLYPEKKERETVYCFFDEIQTMPGWEPFVARLLRTERVVIYLTGSSAALLATEIATQMRGRSLSWELFPFSFREYLDYRGLAAPASLSSKERLLVQQAFSNYWQSGGFPEVLGLSSTLRIKIHQEYFNAILFRDLVERHDISHPKALKDLAHRLIDNTATLYSLNRLTAYLHSLGHSVPKAAVAQYLHWFEDAYFLFHVRLLDPSLSRSQANPKKVYCIDHALVSSVAAGVTQNDGLRLENLVFVALRRLYPELSYHKTASGREIDFVVARRGRVRWLVQVCESLADPRTRAREVEALAEAQAELGAAEAVIVTREEQASIKAGGRRIEVVPAWRFLLHLPDEADE